ncbi:putative ankyrin repeat protein RF_0381 [Microplitis mediator]|uniref:putative ankyrin repeat protein RF_0381 n=1 Tax=Microplitis mediator TaxID=375433 RepID=UPI002554C067|nr:putative ankyrin repeat protein RF_0381 [Microplitis mediator]
MQQSERESGANECRDLIRAIESQNEDYINNLTTINFNINETHPDFGNPLRKALRVGNYKIFKKLIELGADIHQRISATEATTLVDIVKFANCDIVKYLIVNGADNHTRFDVIRLNDNDGTLLHLAAMDGKKDIITLLLDNNANINSKCATGRTPITYAIIRENYDAMDALIKYGPDLFCQFTWRDETVTNFHVAIPAKNWKMLYEWLFQFADTIDVNNNNINLFTFFQSQLLLHYALSLCFCSLDVMRYLLNVGVDVNALDSDNKLPIEYKIESTHQQVYIKIIKVHIVKLIAAGLYVCDRNIEAVSTGEFDHDLALCRSEVEKMKKNKIEGTNITFFEVLHKNIHYSAQYLKSVDLVSILEREPSELIFPEYPMYDRMLFFKLLRVFKRVCYIKDSEEIIYNIFDELQLPGTFVRKLYIHLSNNDLERIIQPSHEKNRYIMEFYRKIGRKNNLTENEN